MCSSFANVKSNFHYFILFLGGGGRLNFTEVYGILGEYHIFLGRESGNHRGRSSPTPTSMLATVWQPWFSLLLPVDRLPSIEKCMVCKLQEREQWVHVCVYVLWFYTVFSFMNHIPQRPSGGGHLHT